MRSPRVEIGRPDYCLIGEKSDLKVRNAERGILAVDVIVHGRASHTAAARATGINAIMLASKAIVALEQTSTHTIRRLASL